VADLSSLLVAVFEGACGSPLYVVGPAGPPRRFVLAEGTSVALPNAARLIVSVRLLLEGRAGRRREPLRRCGTGSSPSLLHVPRVEDGGVRTHAPRPDRRHVVANAQLVLLRRVRTTQTPGL
jgi:hypothetical protein